MTPNTKPSAILRHLSFMGGQRDPDESKYVFSLVLGVDKVPTKCFHYRSGLIIRLDDHKEFFDIIDKMAQDTIEGMSWEAEELTFLRGKAHHLLRKMMWPGDSILTFFDLSTGLNEKPVLPVFHEKRWNCYFGETLNRKI